MSRGRVRGPPLRRVRSQASTSWRMPAVRPSSLRSSHLSKDGTAVVGQHADLLEHLDGPFDADVPGAQCRKELGVAHLVTGRVPGQHDDECPADPVPQSSSPAASLAAASARYSRPGQPRVAEVGVRALVEPGEVPAGLEQPGLDPAAGRADRGAGGGLRGAPRRPCW